MPFRPGGGDTDRRVAHLAPFCGKLRGKRLMSFFGNFLFSICMLSGIQRTTATAAGVILATLPAVVALLSRVFLRERLTPRTLSAIALAVAGIVLLQYAKAPDTPASQQALLGNLLMFGAVLCEASYVILGKRLAATRTALRVSALINLWGLTLTAPLGLWQLAHVDLGGLGAGLWTLLVFYSLAAGLFSNLLGNRGEPYEVRFDGEPVIERNTGRLDLNGG